MEAISSSIDIRQLRYFLAAADHRSFRGAAEALRVEASSVSRRIGDLEKSLGASLFQRHSSGVRLTLAGERFLHRVRKIFLHIGDGANDVNAVARAEDGSVSMGISSSLASEFIAELLRDCDRHLPGVALYLVEGKPSEQVAAVRRLELDVAFLPGANVWPRCDIVYLWSERIFVVLPDDHVLVRYNEVHWYDLQNEAFIVSGASGTEIYDRLVRQLADLGHRPDIRLHCIGYDNLLPLVALGHGLTLTSEATTGAVFPGVVYRPIAGEVLPFSAVWSPRNDNPALRRLLSMAKTLSRRIAPGEL